MSEFSINQEETARSIYQAYELLKVLIKDSVPLTMDSQTILAIASMIQKECWGNDGIHTREEILDAFQAIERQLHNIYIALL